MQEKRLAPKRFFCKLFGISLLFAFCSTSHHMCRYWTLCVSGLWLFRGRNPVLFLDSNSNDDAACDDDNCARQADTETDDQFRVWAFVAFKRGERRGHQVGHGTSCHSAVIVPGSQTKHVRNFSWKTEGVLIWTGHSCTDIYHRRRGGRGSHSKLEQPGPLMKHESWDVCTTSITYLLSPLLGKHRMWKYRFAWESGIPCWTILFMYLSTNFNKDRREILLCPPQNLLSCWILCHDNRINATCLPVSWCYDLEQELCTERQQETEASRADYLENHL